MYAPRFAPLLLTSLFALACADDATEGGSGTETGDPTSESSGETSSSSGDGDGDPTGDGDGDPATGDGDGDPTTTGDGDGDPTGDGDGDPTGDGDGDSSLDDFLTLDHVQVKGTHNSYHIQPLIPFDASHEYTHPSLDVQLEDHGVRAFEIDLHRDGDELLVYHIFVIDQETTCDTLVDCLTTIDNWSDNNPDHVPIMVWFEIKDSTGGSPIDDLLLVDQTILEVFEPNEILTPDSVRGEYGSVREALETEGWPTLGEVRGKVMFMILNGGHESVGPYVSGETSLLGRMMFVGTGDYEAPYAAVHKINDPGSDQIAVAHAASVLTASNTCGAGQSDETCFAKLDDGLMTGTHNLMDDFLEPGDGAYFLDLPDGNPVRCNDATAPPECTAEALESL